MKMKMKQYQLKVNHLKLQLGLSESEGKLLCPKETVAIQITHNYKGTILGKKKMMMVMNPFYPIPFKNIPLSNSTYTTNPSFFPQDNSIIDWNLDNLCSFHVIGKDQRSFGPLQLEFHFLSGKNRGEFKTKREVIGKVSLDIAGLVGVEEETNSTSEIETKCPVSLKICGVPIEAKLLVGMEFSELRDGTDNGSRAAEKGHGILRRMKSLTSFKRKNKGKNEQDKQASAYGSDMTNSAFDSEDSIDSGTKNAHLTSSMRVRSFSCAERRVDSVQKSWSLLSWSGSFKRLSFRSTTRRKGDLFTSHSAPLRNGGEVEFYPTKLGVKGKTVSLDWEVKEVKSRDGEAKLKTKVFFASFDQRSQEASGESACAALVALIAHWLHSNQDMPTRPQFDSLIKDGSSEWRKLCSNSAYKNLFPDQHFDLETVIEANMRPLCVLQEKSFTGFFSPEKFECLKGAMSFDEIWDEIQRDIVDYEQRIYMVSWNDHFFVLKVDGDAYYIVDSLGERLFEGCKQAYILKFDDSSLMCTVAKSKQRSEVICRGKECCKEFIKRFLAAIPLRQLEEDEKKRTISNPFLHRQLQIEFHYSSSSSSSSSSFSSYETSPSSSPSPKE